MVDENDIYQNLFYDRFTSHIGKLLEESNSKKAPWYILNGEDIERSTKFILGNSCEIIKERLEELGSKAIKRDYKEKKILEKLDMDKTLSKEKYDEIIEDLQKEARDLAYELYVHQIPSILIFEGVDAAGKGGAIRRLTRYIDPRGYQINPTSAPSDAEKGHHYLWRFYNNFPELGQMDIFDRSWYGRLMVERVEGFASEEEWERAYNEINTMERELVESNIMLVKYFISIDKDTQLERFKDREIEKPHKLTEEDWRNREKWDDNIKAMNEMLDRTSTDCAPWNIIAGNSKEYARVEVIKTFIDQAKKKLKIE